MLNTHCPACRDCEKRFRLWERLDDILCSDQNTFGRRPGYLSTSLQAAASVLRDLGETDLSDQADDLDVTLETLSKRLEGELVCAAYADTNLHELCEVHDA